MSGVNVQVVLQIQIGVMVVVICGVMGVIVCEVIVYQFGGDIVILQFWWNIVVCMVIYKCLGDGEVQVLLFDVEVCGSFVDKCGQWYVGCVVQCCYVWYLIGIYIYVCQLVVCQVGGQIVILGIGLEGDVSGGYKIIVEINIDVIGVWWNFLVFFKF